VVVHSYNLTEFLSSAFDDSGILNVQGSNMQSCIEETSQQILYGVQVVAEGEQGQPQKTTSRINPAQAFLGRLLQRKHGLQQCKTGNKED
jgi:hypothetical protein